MNIYQSILKRLSELSEEQLKDADNFLRSLHSKLNAQDNRAKIMELAGSWKDMSDADFDAYMDYIKK